MAATNQLAAFFCFGIIYFVFVPRGTDREIQNSKFKIQN